MTHPHRHSSHSDVLNRLKRAEGHLRSITQMIEQGRPCVSVAQQMHAVEKAIAEAKRILIRDHIDHCLEEAVGDLPDPQRASLSEFKDITKYL